MLSRTDLESLNMTNFPLNLGDVLICLRAWIIPSASAVKMLELSQMRLEKTPKEILLPEPLQPEAEEHPDIDENE